MSESAQRQPKISIVIANHNYGKFVGQAIESALSQTYVDIKVVVVDDASTDNSKEKIRYYAGKDARVVPIYREKCGGASVARNDAINKVWNDTDFYLILDADDTIYPNKVAELLKVAVQTPQIGAIYADYDILNMETGNIIREYKEPFSLKRLQQECIVHSGSLISKVALDKIKRSVAGDYEYYCPELHGPATETFIGCSEDYLLWLMIAKFFLIVHVPKTLSLVRVHGNNASRIENVNPVWKTNSEIIQRKLAECQ